MQRKSELRGNRIPSPPNSQEQDGAKEEETDEEIDVEDSDQVGQIQSGPKVS